VSKAERIIIFTRFPEAGKAKTRLIPVMGPAGAAELHKRMTEHTLSRVLELHKTRALSIEVRYAGGNRIKMREWLGSGVYLRRQLEADLGTRMAAGFRDGFVGGATRVVIIGTDCPGMTARLLQEAFDTLASSELVLGPTEDGGYYLIGMCRFLPQLFTDIAWGTNKVLEQTLDRCVRLGVRPARLKILADVDRPEDLTLFGQAK
jgi:rSAM/selenodomain-associated transferase 1